jgi:hypothetical protein
MNKELGQTVELVVFVVREVECINVVKCDLDVR